MLWNSGVACVALAAFTFSFIGLCTKLLDDSIPSVHVTLLMGSISWCLTTLTLLATKLRSKRQQAPSKVPLSKALLLLLRGIIGAVNVSCLLTAMQLLPLQDAVPIYFSSGVVALLLEAALFRKPIGCAALLGCLLTISGVALVGQPACPVHIPLPGHPQACHHVAAAGPAAMPAVLNSSSTGARWLPPRCDMLQSQGHGGAEPALVSHRQVLAALLELMFTDRTHRSHLDGPPPRQETDHHLPGPATGSLAPPTSAGAAGGAAAGAAGSSPVADYPLGLSQHNLGVALALGGAVLNAIQFLIISHIGTAVSLSFMAFAYWTVLVAATFASVAAAGGLPSLLPGDLRTWGLLMGIAVSSWLGQVLLGRGLQLGHPSRGAAINTTQVFWSFVWGVAVLAQPVTLCGIMGGAAIMAGVVASCLPALMAARAAGDDDLEVLLLGESDRDEWDADMAIRAKSSMLGITPLGAGSSAGPSVLRVGSSLLAGSGRSAMRAMSWYRRGRQGLAEVGEGSDAESAASAGAEGQDDLQRPLLGGRQ
jgi:drug/metabolite transporter (DMT)-like permease